MSLRSITKSVLLGLLAGTCGLVAQQGDKAGEVQALLVPKDQIPPAPILSATEALATFQLKPGFRLEVVASDPLVHDPIAAAFDPDGRIWVLEMRGFMPNPDGVGETNKVGSVVVLDDRDGDGKMDSRTEFVSGLVMPRAIGLFRDGVLVAEPPMLWFFRDTDGDGKADERTEVANDYATQADPKLGSKANPEHASNGLMWALDNWIYSANHTVRFRNTRGRWERENTVFRGQWGISQDNYGRLVYNSNSDQLRMDLVPSAYLARNPNFKEPLGLNVDPVKNQKTWPIRITPGINRGYQAAMLREGRLATVTAACGPVVYRGDQFPEEYRGNMFICEPSGHLMKRNIVRETEGRVSGQHAYPDSEFLASKDERFRPVNAYTGPDGALYIVDLYRGILQHRIYMTSYLRTQVEERGLDKGTGLGRIYRVVHEGRPLGARPQLSKATNPTLVRQLSHPNGWWRDTAQRLLVERAAHDTVPLLRELASSGTDPLGRLHALWTLDGLDRTDEALLVRAFRDPDPKVRAAAIRLSERFLTRETAPRLLAQYAALIPGADADTALQLAFTVGQVPSPEAIPALLQLALSASGRELVRDAILSGLGGNEGVFLARFLEATGGAAQESQAGLKPMVRALAKCVAVEGRGPNVAGLLDLAAGASRPGWQTESVLSGLLGIVPAAPKGRPAPPMPHLKLAAEPAGLARLAANSSPGVQALVPQVRELLVWPGKAGYVEDKPAAALTPAQKELFEKGKELYVISCGACHQPHGNGMEGLAPPLAGSEWVSGSDERFVRIALHGVRGPITVKGKTYTLEMPAFGVFEDEQIASILTYVRREWGNTGNPIEPATVGAIRKKTESRIDAWTEKELLAIP